MKKLLLLFGAVTLLFAACTNSTDDEKRNLIDEIANAKDGASIDVEKLDVEVDEKGDYTVNAKGLAIANMKLSEASLTVSEEVADGNFTFTNGKLNTLTIKGGEAIVIEDSALDTLCIDGGTSVSIKNCTIKNLVVKKDGVKVTLSGATKIETEMKIEADNCTLDADGTDNSIAEIALSASVKQLTIDASDKSSLDISNVTVDKPADGEEATKVTITVKNPDCIEKIDDALKGSVAGGNTGSGSGNTGGDETGGDTGSGSGNTGSGETGGDTGSGSGNTGSGETGGDTGSGSGTGSGETGGNMGSGSGSGSGETGGNTGSGSGTGSGETGGNTGSGSGNTGGDETPVLEIKSLYLVGDMNSYDDEGEKSVSAIRNKFTMESETIQKYTFVYHNDMKAWGGGDGKLAFKVCYGAGSVDWSLDWGASDWSSVVNLIVNDTKWIELAHRDENNLDPGNIVVQDLLDGEEYTIEIEYDPSTISVKIRMYGKMIAFPNLSFVSVDESGNKVEEFPLERKGTNYSYVFTPESDGSFKGYLTDGKSCWGAEGEAQENSTGIKYIESECKSNKQYKIAATVDPTNLEKLLEISFGMYITSLYNYDSLAYICSNYGNYKLVWGDEQVDGSYEATVIIPVGTLNEWGQTDTADIEFGVTKDDSWNNKYTNAILTMPDVRYQTEKSGNNNNKIVDVNPSEKAVTITVISTEKEIFVKYAQ